VKSLSELRKEKPLVPRDAAGVGHAFVSDDDVPPDQLVWIRGLEGTGVDPGAYAALHEGAHLWIQADYERDLGRLIAVGYPLEVGVDYVMLPFRYGNSTAQLVRRPDLWAHIPQFMALREAFLKNREERRGPRDLFFEELLSPHVVDGSLQAVFWAPDQCFSVIDLCASRDDLRRWQSLNREASEAGPG
jgi:hypothetical protein